MALPAALPSPLLHYPAQRLAREQALLLWHFVMTVVQALDGFVGTLAHDSAKTFGPFVFALANVAALIWMLRASEEADQAQKQV
jgi:hypothetical protein